MNKASCVRFTAFWIQDNLLDQLGCIDGYVFNISTAREVVLVAGVTWPKFNIEIVSLGLIHLISSLHNIFVYDFDSYDSNLVHLCDLLNLQAFSRTKISYSKSAV